MFTKILSVDQSWLLAVNHFATSSHFWQVIFKFLGTYLIYLAPLFLVVLWFWSAQSKKIALRATLSGAFAWLVIANVLGRVINRPRPFEIVGIKELLFHRPDYSFPSDHAAFLFAIAISFYYSGYKKLAFWSLLVALFASLGRIGIGFHYPLDIVAGAVIGWLAAWLVWLFDRPLNYLYNFLISLAKKLKLA